MSLRAFLWEKISGAGLGLMAMPEKPTMREIIISSVIAGVLIALSWLVVRRGFFHLSESARASRFASIVFGVIIALAWLLGSLELIGLNSARWMLIVMIVSTMGSITYLVWVKNR